MKDHLRAEELSSLNPLHEVRWKSLPSFAKEMNFCLDCQACETACPAGVKYGSMVEAARVEVDNTSYRSWFYKFVKKFLLSTIVGSRSKSEVRFEIASHLPKFFSSENCCTNPE